MKFDTAYLGPQELTADDRSYTGSRFADVRAALFRSTYYLTWGAAGEPPLPVYAVSLGRVLKGILSRRGGWSLLQAAGRALDSPADLRPGPDGRGYRRLLHPNGVCLFGRWIIDQPTPYSGYFRQGKEALIIGRYSTCCTETRSGRYRSLSLVGKLYPTTDPEHCEPLQTANFITQEDIGGRRTSCINDAVLRSTPDTTPWRRGLGLPILLLTGLAFLRSDRQPTARQLYQIAELDKPDSDPTRTPEYMQLKVSEGQARIEEDSLDFREEILRHIYGAGNQTAPRLTFDIEVTDRAVTRGRLVQRRSFPDGWKRIGRIEFDEAVVSYDGDFVIHFQHPPWRDNPNDPNTIHRNRAGAAPRSE